jgi:transcriptional regulator GlxA family with amidase domain
MEQRRVVVVGYDGVELLDIACVTSTLQGANRIARQDLYRVELVSMGAQDIDCAGGAALRAHGSVERTIGAIDTLVVSGGDGHRVAAADALLIAHVRRLARDSRRVASVCTGATVLAAAGLLDGRHATTHWFYAKQLAKDYPKVCVDPDPIYIREGRIATSAGVTSALDLTLSFVSEDHGEGLARDVARGLVTYLHRPGNQAQVSMFTAPDPPDHRLVALVVDHIATHVGDRLDTAALAGLFGISERQLNRLFLAHTGLTPGRYIRRVRTEVAARLLTTSELPIAGVAQACGFGTAETLRQAFVQHYDLPPSRYRHLTKAPPHPAGPMLGERAEPASQATADRAD